MRVAIEVDYAGAGVRGGTHYINHLLENLARVAPEDEFLIFGFLYKDFERKIAQVKVPSAANIKVAVKRWPQSLVNRVEWDWRLPLIEGYLALRGVDAYHCFRPPSRAAKRVVVMQPDITPLTIPEWHPPESQAVWERITRPGLLRAGAIMTYCEASKRDMVTRLGIAPERIHITHLGIDHGLFSGAPGSPAARLKHGLPERYFLMVGPFDVLCNFETVLGALKLWKAASEPPKIVCVGPLDDYVAGLQKRAQEEGLADLFHWTGYVPHKELGDLYRFADGLLYPSNLPGVELPPYEAMACGTPVVTSLPENVEDAGLVIDAKSPAQLYEAARKVWESPALRAELREKGLARAAQFTWERCARETLAVYRSVAV